jgi:hypothetical protein
MLAYVFWHWPQPGVATDEYQRLQLPPGLDAVELRIEPIV